MREPGPQIPNDARPRERGQRIDITLWLHEGWTDWDMTAHPYRQVAGGGGPISVKEALEQIAQQIAVMGGQ